MAVTTTQTNKPINPRGNDQSPKGYNRAALYSGKALDFDGVNDNVEVSAFSTTGSTRSLSYYFKASTSGNKRVFEIKSGSNFFNSTIFNGKINTFDGVNGINTTKTFNDNKWHHVVITHNGNNNAAIYVDGVSQELDASTFSVHDITNQTLYIAGLISVYYDGGLSNIRLFNVALTAAQVADLYNNPEKVVPTGVDNTALKLWLPMMEGAGTTAYDGSGNGNHGTISGATYTHAIGAPVSQTAVIDWNKSYYFDGVDDSFTTGTYQALGDRTITLSFYSSDFSLTDDYPNTLFAFNTASGGNTDIVRISADGYVAVYDGATRLGTPTIQANENELTHIAIVTDAGSETKVYVNGELSYSYNAWSPSVGASDIFNIGQETDGASISDLWRGFIFNIGVFGSVLTQSEIQAIQGKRYADLTSAQKTNLVSFYSLQNDLNDLHGSKNLTSTGSPNALLIPQGLTSGRDLLGNLFENVRKQGALNLDGNSWAEVHDNASVDLTTAISMECWAYIDDLVSTRVFFAKWAADSAQRAYVLYQSGDDLALTLSDGSNYGTSSTNVLTTGWHHIVATYVQNGNMTYYVDGSQTDAFAFTRAIRTTTAEIEIGRNEGPTGANYFKNQLAQPRIYNRALTAEEVERNYNAGKNIYQ